MKKSFMNNIKNFVDSNVRQRIDRAAHHYTEPFSDDILAVERHFEDIRQVCVDADKKISALLQSIQLSSSSSHLGSYTKNVQAGLNNLSQNISLQAVSITASSGSNSNIAAGGNIKPNEHSGKSSQQSPTNGEIMFASSNDAPQYHSSESLINASYTLAKSHESILTHSVPESNDQLREQLSDNIQERYKKLPVVGFYKFLVKSNQKLPQDSLLAIALKQCSKIQVQLANLYLAYEKAIETQCLKPIQNMIETDIPNVIKLRKLYIKSHNDYEFLKTRYNGASLKQHSQLNGQLGNSTNTSYLVSQSSIQSANTNKLDQLKNELDDAITRLEQSRHTYEAELYGFVCRETELVKLLRIFYKYQTEYHLQVGTIIQGLMPALSDSLASIPRKPAFGTQLQMHLHCTGREISPVIELCVHFLHSQGLKEEGLFRIPGSSAKIKKLKNGINAWFLSLANLDELESDQRKQSAHCITALYHLFEDAAGQRNTSAELAQQVSTLSNNVLKSTLAGDEAALNQMNFSSLRDHETTVLDVHSLAGLLKLYLRELPEPLCTFSLYDDWIHCVDNKADNAYRLDLISAVIERLPSVNQENIKHLVKFLHLLTKHQEVNKMTSTNLAIAMAPSFIWSKPVEHDIQDGGNLEDAESLNMQMSTFGISASHHAMILEALINNADTLFPEPSDFSLPGFENLKIDSGKNSSPRSRTVKSTSPTGLSTTSSSSFSSSASNSTSSSVAMKGHTRKGGSMEGLLAGQEVNALLQDQNSSTRSAGRPVSVQLHRSEYVSSVRQHRKFPVKPPVPVLRSQYRQSISHEQSSDAPQANHKPPAPPVPPPTSVRHQLERLKAATASETCQSTQKPKPISLRGTGTIEESGSTSTNTVGSLRVTRPNVPPPARPRSTLDEPVGTGPSFVITQIGSQEESGKTPDESTEGFSSDPVRLDLAQMGCRSPIVSLDSVSESSSGSSHGNLCQGSIDQSLSDEPCAAGTTQAKSNRSGVRSDVCQLNTDSKCYNNDGKTPLVSTEASKRAPPVKPPRSLSPKGTQSTPL